MHIALGVRNTAFPIDRFLDARGRATVTISTAARPRSHERATLTFSSNPSRRGGEKHGAGLGLAIAREIVQAHGGKINVRSRLGEGTSFDVFLPLTGKSATTIVRRK